MRELGWRSRRGHERDVREIVVQFPEKEQDFISLLRISQNVSVANLHLYSMGNRGRFLGGKSGRKVKPIITSSSSKVKHACPLRFFWQNSNKSHSSTSPCPTTDSFKIIPISNIHVYLTLWFKQQVVILQSNVSFKTEHRPIRWDVTNTPVSAFW
jgi:hypothetical protein